MAFCFAYWPKRREMVSRVPYKGRPLDTVFKDCIECSEVFTLLQHKPLVNPDKLRDPPPLKDDEPWPKRPKKGKGKGKGKGKPGNSFARISLDLLSLGCVGIQS